MTRIRPTMEDWRKARMFDWLTQHWDRVDWTPWNRKHQQWQLYASEDPYDHRIAGWFPTLEKAIEKARDGEEA